MTGAARETASLFDDYVRFASVPADHPAAGDPEGAAPLIFGSVAQTLTAGLKGDTSVAEVARKHRLKVAEVEEWRELFLLAEGWQIGVGQA